MLSLSVFPHPIRFLSSASLPVPATQPSVSSFPFLLRFASQWLFGCRPSAFQPPGFSASAPPGFPCFAFAFKYSAFCSFPFILPGFAPTAVPPVLPLCFRFRAFPALKLSFVRFSLGSDYSAIRSFFSLLPVFPWRRFPRCIFSSSVRPVAMPSFRFRYSAFCNSFLRPPFRFTEATTAPRPRRSVSLGLRFRCRILGHSNSLFREFCSLIHLTRQKRTCL